MDLHLLEILLAFKKYGTLSSTAEALHISQPTLTRNMQTLEEEVDVPVFIHGSVFISVAVRGFAVGFLPGRFSECPVSGVSPPFQLGNV